MTEPHRKGKFEDPIVAEVRKAGDEIAREAGYDIHVLCKRLREAERQHTERLAQTRPAVPSDD